jgi:hypothetical protein
LEVLHILTIKNIDKYAKGKLKSKEGERSEKGGEEGRSE